MKIRLTLLPCLLLAILASSGTPAHASCGAHAHPGAGECIKQQLRARGFALAPATATPAAQGVDISNWQGVPDLNGARRSGIRFLIIQTNDGFFRNPFYWLQAAAARNAGIPFGTYTFLEGASGAAQANLSASIAAGTGRSLGIWADAEQSSAYPVTCSYVNAAAAHAHIFGVYGSPGTYAGGRCRGYLWPAEWGSGHAYSFAGYPPSAIKVRQWCGTCRVPWHAGEIDRDESLGLLALAAPAPTPAQKHAALIRRRDTLLADLHRHGCFHVHGRHAFVLCPRWGALWRAAERQLHHHA
jgi:hypothetical protein